MPLPVTNLDDLTFDSLKSELRRRIPAYTPEWTDFNESDPGIALIELFAWLADILVYRINKIPDNAYVKFLQLIDIQLDLPVPAEAYLTFTLVSKDLPNAVPVPGGTRVGLSSASATPVIFETADNLYACGASLAAVQTYDGARYTVISNFNPTDGSAWYPLSKFPEAGAAVYLGFDRAFPSAGGYQFPLTILLNTPAVTGSAQGATTQNAAGSNPPIIGVLEHSTSAGWSPIAVVSDGTAALTQSGVIQFKAPSDWAAVQYGGLRKSSDPAYYWMRYRIDQLLGPGYQAPPQISNILINTIKARNAVTVEWELLGASNGLPNQTFQLSNFPVLPIDPSVAGIVQVDEGDGNGFTLWTQVSGFSGYNRDSKVYTLDYSTGAVTFGDGVYGKIPHWLSSDGSNLEPADLPNIRVTQYQWGGGAAGNAGANSITSLIDTVPFVASVTNLLPSALGADEESVSEAEDRAPEVIRTLNRAVSAEDFVALALRTPGGHIRRATAIPLQRPITDVVRAPDGSVVLPPPAPGVVTVLVVPEGPDPSMPVASDQTLAAVAQHLDTFRLVTCELYVARPIYRLVEIQARVIVTPTAISGEVQTALEQALLTFYNPLVGGQPPVTATPLGVAPAGATPTGATMSGASLVQGKGWPFGGTIFVSDAYRQILQVDGVQSVAGTIQIYLDGVLQPQDKDIALQPFELVYSKNHTLDVSYPP
jgi:predicted phage baseplate assembly protein